MSFNVKISAPFIQQFSQLSKSAGSIFLGENSKYAQNNGLTDSPCESVIQVMHSFQNHYLDLLRPQSLSEANIPLRSVFKANRSLAMMTVLEKETARQTVIKNPRKIFDGVVCQDGYSLGHFDFVERVFKTWEEVLTIGGGSLFIHNIRKDELTLRHLPVRFQIGAALYCFKDQATDIIVTSQLSSVEEKEAMILKNESPLFLSPVSEDLAEYEQKKIHPYLRGWYEMLLRQLLSRLNKETRSELVACSQVIEKYITDVKKGSLIEGARGRLEVLHGFRDTIASLSQGLKAPAK